MINLNEISSEWLNHVSKQHRNADKILAEKVIRALLLLEGLAKQKLSYVFKSYPFIREPGAIFIENWRFITEIEFRRIT